MPPSYWVMEIATMCTMASDRWDFQREICGRNSDFLGNLLTFLGKFHWKTIGKKWLISWKFSGQILLESDRFCDRSWFDELWRIWCTWFLVNFSVFCMFLWISQILRIYLKFAALQPCEISEALLLQILCHDKFTLKQGLRLTAGFILHKHLWMITIQTVHCCSDSFYTCT